MKKNFYATNITVMYLYVYNYFIKFSRISKFENFSDEEDENENPPSESTKVSCEKFLLESDEILTSNIKLSHKPIKRKKQLRREACVDLTDSEEVKTKKNSIKKSRPSNSIEKSHLLDDIDGDAKKLRKRKSKSTKAKTRISKHVPATDVAVFETHDVNLIKEKIKFVQTPSKNPFSVNAIVSKPKKPEPTPLKTSPAKTKATVKTAQLKLVEQFDCKGKVQQIKSFLENKLKKTFFPTAVSSL